ncbi:MAG: hypothetical protein EXR72_05210 [Myxococcales bacterium]|nr:hypothetical protein [Myxococcales bacterium]
MSDEQPDAPVPSLLPPPVDPSAYDLKGKKSKLPTILVILGLLAAVGALTMKLMKGRNERKLHAAFMERFKEVESGDVSQFWICLLGPNVDPGLFADNVALGQRIDGTFAGDPLHFPEKVLDECVPRLKGLNEKAATMEAPEDYREALARYGKSLDDLGSGITSWAERAKGRGEERNAEKKIEQAGTAFHATAGKAVSEAIAYAGFLRCVAPEIDKMADAQPLLQLLFEECKKPEFVAKIRTQCAKLVIATEGKEDKAFKDLFKKFGADDRELQAFHDCFKKSRKAGKQDDLSPFGKAWVSYMETSGAVRKIGAAALKND